MPLGLACENFRITYLTTLERAIRGARVPKVCHPKTTPVEFGS
jgi:hypothetical protein